MDILQTKSVFLYARLYDDKDIYCIENTLFAGNRQGEYFLVQYSMDAGVLGTYTVWDAIFQHSAFCFFIYETHIV